MVQCQIGVVQDKGILGEILEYFPRFLLVMPISQSGAKRFRKQSSTMYKNLYVRLSLVFKIIRFISVFIVSILYRTDEHNANLYQQSNTTGKKTIGTNCCIYTNKSLSRYKSVTGSLYYMVMLHRLRNISEK